MEKRKDDFLYQFLTNKKTMNNINTIKKETKLANKTLDLKKLSAQKYGLKINKNNPIKILPIASLTQNHFYSNTNSLLKPSYINRDSNRLNSRVSSQKDFFTIENKYSHNFYQNKNKEEIYKIILTREKFRSQNNTYVSCPKIIRNDKILNNDFIFEYKNQNKNLNKFSRTQLSFDNLTNFSTTPTTENTKSNKCYNNLNDDKINKLTIEDSLSKLSKKDISSFKLTYDSKNFIINRMKAIKDKIYI